MKLDYKFNIKATQKTSRTKAKLKCVAQREMRSGHSFIPVHLLALLYTSFHSDKADKNKDSTHEKTDRSVASSYK